MSFALIKANCNNPRRIAAALAQWVIESGHFKYTEEIASGPENQERWKYKGRTWIQITWLDNYRGFGQWCNSIGLVQYPDYFVDYPKKLAEQQWAALGPAYWWAIKYPQINEYADRGDIDNVSKWVNAPAWVDNPNKHANHEKERRDVYNTALSLGDQLLSLTTGAPPQEDELSAEAERLIREIHEATLTEGQSMYATGPGPKTTPAAIFAWEGPGRGQCHPWRGLGTGPSTTGRRRHTVRCAAQRSTGRIPGGARQGCLPPSTTKGREQRMTTTVTGIQVKPKNTKAWISLIGGLIVSQGPLLLQFLEVLPAPWGAVATGVGMILAAFTGGATQQVSNVPTGTIPILPTSPPPPPPPVYESATPSQPDSL